LFSLSTVPEVSNQTPTHKPDVAAQANRSMTKPTMAKAYD
jgi:hypothetical protein